MNSPTATSTAGAKAPASDGGLVEAVRAGQPRAFDAIYDRYHGRLFSLCLQMLRDRTEAEDALQQTFLNAYRSMREGENDLTLGAWLNKIARNECLSRIRSRRELPIADGVVVSPSLTTEAEGREELSEVLRDLKRLPEEQATALTLSTLNDLSHAEIGEVIGCDANKVKSLAHRAHRSLTASREARAQDCAEVREMLDELSGGSLRRIEIRDHLRDCPGCREYRDAARVPVAA